MVLVLVRMCLVLRPSVAHAVPAPGLQVRRLLRTGEFVEKVVQPHFLALGGHPADVRLPCKWREGPGQGCCVHFFSKANADKTVVANRRPLGVIPIARLYGFVRNCGVPGSPSRKSLCRLTSALDFRAERSSSACAGSPPHLHMAGLQGIGNIKPQKVQIRKGSRFSSIIAPRAYLPWNEGATCVGKV